MVTIYVLREKKQIIFFYCTRYSNSDGRNFTLNSYILPALSLVEKYLKGSTVACIRSK